MIKMSLTPTIRQKPRFEIGSFNYRGSVPFSEYRQAMEKIHIQPVTELTGPPEENREGFMKSHRIFV